MATGWVEIPLGLPSVEGKRCVLKGCTTGEAHWRIVYVMRLAPGVEILAEATEGVCNLHKLVATRAKLLTPQIHYGLTVMAESKGFTNVPPIEQVKVRFQSPGGIIEREI
jgi:hypothetical protein